MTPTYRWFRNGSPLSGQTSDTLSFSPLSQTDSGSYSCEATRSSATLRSASVTITAEGKAVASYSFMLQPLIINYADPALSAIITTSGAFDEGASISLTCEVIGDERLAVSFSTFRWDKDGREYSRNPTLTFNPLRRDDAGEYRCTSTFFSPYLTGSRTVTQTIVVTVNSKYID